MKLRVGLVLLVLAFRFAVQAAELRKWTNLGGQIVEAELISVDSQDRALVLRLGDGKEVTVQIDQLSLPDREHARNAFQSGVVGPTLPPRYRHRSTDALRQASILRGSGSPAVEAAVVRSLELFQTTQNDDGSWGRSNKGAITGFVLQCFLGHGETADSAKFGDSVMKGLVFLVQLAGQNPHGMLSENWQKAPASTYEHAIATAALGEAWVLSRTSSKTVSGLRECFEKAVNLIISTQTPRGAWCYGGKDGIAYNARGTEDLSLSNWHFLALQTARESTLPFQNLDVCVQRALKYVESKRTKLGGFGGINKDAHYNQWILTGGALTGLQLLSPPGHNSTDIGNAVGFVCGVIAAEPPRWDASCNVYSWFGSVNALSLAGGKSWKENGLRFVQETLAAQNADGSFKRGTPSWPAAAAAEDTYRQALSTLILEVFYRFPAP